MRLLPERHDHVTRGLLLDANPDPSEADIREALRFNLCRCGAHIEIIAAVRLAATLRPRMTALQPQGLAAQTI